MAFYRICPDCGAYLDPGEQCSCHEERLIEMERKEKASHEIGSEIVFVGMFGIALFWFLNWFIGGDEH